MPGRLRTSFRSGNLAEDLGLLLLKGTAAVAEVARPEDVGLDAVANLLRRDTDGNCYAEDSFLVQLKAESVTTLEYKDHELAWFLAQTQPMFFGLVSLAKSEVSLYPTIHVNQAVLALHAKSVTIKFGVSDILPLLPGQEWGRWSGGGEWHAKVWLGPPLLRWSLADLTTPGWAQRTYAILKRFLVLARWELELLSFGHWSCLQWQPNDLESISSSPFSSKTTNEDLPSLVGRLNPCFRSLLLRAIAMPGDRGLSLCNSLLSVVAALRPYGMDLDPDNFFATVSASIRKSSILAPYQPPPATEHTSAQSQPSAAAGGP
jgi:hypothetical protein